MEQSARPETTKTESTPVPEPKSPWFDAACALLMAAASLSTAWCSYQNARWSGRTSGLQARADSLERKATALVLQSREYELAHLELAMHAIDAMVTGNEKASQFYIGRFPEELKSAWDKWMALRPFENPKAPPHPFVSSLYEPRFNAEINECQTVAAQNSNQSKSTNQSAVSYASNTVLLACVLFFAGTAGKFDEKRVRQPSLGFALALFIYSAVRMLMLPVA